MGDLDGDLPIDEFVTGMVDAGVATTAEQLQDLIALEEIPWLDGSSLGVLVGARFHTGVFRDFVALQATSAHEPCLEECAFAFSKAEMVPPMGDDRVPLWPMEVRS